MLIATLTGNLGQDAEYKTTPNGQTMLSFSVASNQRSRDGDKTTWVRCTLWGKRADALAPHLTKGKSVCVIGELSTREHNGKTYVDLKVSELDFMGGKSGSQSRSEPRQSPAADEGDPPF